MSNTGFFWNIRGINDPDKHKPFSNWLASSKALFGGWNFYSNHSSDPDGRIILIWKSPLAVNIIRETSQAITCEVLIGPLQKFTLTACYAANTSPERCDLLVELLDIQQQLSMDSTLWVVGGDFNQIIHFSEHSLPSVDCYDPPMIEFRDTLSQLGLFDLRFIGPLHTWSNKNPSFPIAKKLDHVLVNHPWISSYPHSQIFFLPPKISDNSPSLLTLAVDLPTSGIRPFKFFNYLTKHPLFLQSVLQGWDQAGSIAWDLAHLCVKLKK
ncbi:hypothetical protein Bca52824_033847 [Brassica carinata]|uniref:Endonuclease/exonuclease/phosphatase domain-containing protein n=1 Tax=Brassica carinata TaxID=52824 RepID=A0A8X7V9P5_BRACI|nr:hypothetical protein Bca52824_033847 [Brassica carinata]